MLFSTDERDAAGLMAPGINVTREFAKWLLHMIIAHNYRIFILI
jgi:hypothetical protein